MSWVFFANSEQVSYILRVVFVDAVNVFVCWVKCSCLTCFMSMALSCRNQSIYFHCESTVLSGTWNMLSSFIKPIKQRHVQRQIKFKENKFAKKTIWKWFNCRNTVIRVFINQFQPRFALYVETSHLICCANQMTGFYMKYNTGIKWVF